MIDPVRTAYDHFILGSYNFLLLAQSQVEARTMCARFDPRMSDYSPACGSKAEGGIHCPHCGGAVVRIRRLAVDRLLSLVSPRHRFRCAAFGCGWEGTLRLKGPRSHSTLIRP
jgi:hypothetical protein